MTLRELEQVTITALKEGSVEAINLCFDLYYAALCSSANFYVKQPTIAEEIVQGVFVDFWINRKNIPSQSSVKGYLMTSVKHDCLDFLKHKKIEEQYADQFKDEMMDSYEDIFADLVNKDLQEALNNAINKLPQQCKEIFLMSRFKYMSYKEIATSLSLSIKTIENQMGKALKIVRAELDSYL
ncbi:MAG: RNA polymerase sigma-70 factor [Bacteroidetes bacterium]|nr:RNA polymerase sigma-70 factor [Bacteroidota bacterium]